MKEIQPVCHSDCLQAHHVLVALAALGVTGRHWPCVEAYGGPKQLAQQGFETLFGVLVQTGKASKSGKDRQQLSQMLHTALQQARQLDAFVTQGGWIMGVQGSRELMRLNRCRAPLLCAFFEGNRQHIRHRPVVAIVGSRKADARGLQRTRDLAYRLAQEGILIVSGAAMGTDCAAHEAAVQAGGCTLAILGDPLNPSKSLLPKRLSHLPADLVSVLTPFGPWVAPASFLFAARNQYMASLADAVVVMQGTAGSGTLHTARYAQQLGVPLWAMPGDVEDPLAAAGNELLEQGWARACISSESLLGHVLKTPKKSVVNSLETVLQKREQKAAKLDLNEAQQKLLGMLHSCLGVATVDELCQKLQMQVQQLQSMLLELELKGLIVRKGAQVVLGEV
ncbi:MAG: DNA-processing protein DprA [Myxococcota bacterium]